ncbi:MAG: hypothetical protein HYZ42_14215 [Bacteroidetes bacterium]|nr:hypothetical protein [Bacteroidota bacterium]
MARKAAIKHGTTLSVAEMQLLVTNLLECQSPSHAPDGTAIYMTQDVAGLLKLIR